MPPADTILASLTRVANQWWLASLLWHVLLGLLLLAVLLGWRPRVHLAAYLLALPVISVSVFSWLGANPFNGAVFALLASAMMVVARRLPCEPVPRETTPFLAPGALLIVFGWMYPHFVQADSLVTYFYASPFGLLPCPTLAVVVGLTLVLRLEGSLQWSMLLAAAGTLYGAIGVFVLHVAIDYTLLAGVVILTVATSCASSARSGRRRLMSRPRLQETP